MPLNIPRTVVFDLDGTLVDTAPDLTAALNHCLGRLDLPTVPPETVRHLVGHGARALIERGLSLAGRNDPSLVDRALPLFLEHYAANIAVGSRPYPGAEAALGELADTGAVLAICTNKPAALSQALIDALGWGGRFAANLGGDSLDVRKPHPRHVTATVVAAGGAVHDAAFVGDTEVDIAAARGAGLPVIVVGFGFSAAPVAELGADAVIEDYAELLPALAGLRGGER